jgi:cytochrome d ubiquinol oxidase subunit II
VNLDRALIWGGLIAFAVLAYILMDGFDLGIGILFPFLGGESHQDDAMTSVSPVWDGNETWLILGGGGLLAVFPLSYSIMLTALYVPVIAMLLGLVLRGVAFEYRWRTRRGRFLWDWSFTIGSLVATLCQGIMLGAIVQGIPVEGRAYAGGWWDWLTPFSMFTGVALVVGYTLLGSTWLIMKTDGALQQRAQTIAWYAAPATVALIGVASLWTVFTHPHYMDRWFSVPQVLYVMIVPALVLLFGTRLVLDLNAHRDVRPFLYAQGLFVLCYIGLGISLYPYLIPPSVSLWDAAAPDKILGFLLVGAVVLVPMIIGYTVFAYWVFRGKVDSSHAAH